MKISKEMIYTDRTNIDDFLKCENEEECKFNKGIYKIMLTFGEHNSTSLLETFNAAYCQCTYAMWLEHPELELDIHRLLGDYKNAKTWEVYYIVWALLSVLPERSFEINLLVDKIEYEYLHTSTSDGYINKIKDIVDDYDLPFTPVVNVDLSPNPGSTSEYDFMWDDPKDWYDFTDGFSRKAIRKIVGLWRTREDQLWVLDVIEKAYDIYKKKEKSDTVAEVVFTSELDENHLPL